MFRHHLLPNLVSRLLAERALPAGRIGDVRIDVHPSGVFAIVVLTAAIARSFVPSLFPDAPLAATIAIAGLCATLLLVSVLARELAQALTAHHEKIDPIFALRAGADLEIRHLVDTMLRDPDDPIIVRPSLEVGLFWVVSFSM